MLLSRVERIRWQQEERMALHAEAWLEALRRLLEACRTSLRPQAVPADLLGILHRMDWWLEHVRRSERALKRPLRQRAPDLNAQVRAATEQAFHLRNQMISFFIRWKAFQDADRSAEPTAYLDRRKMEEARLAATRTSRELAPKVDEIAPVLRRGMGGPRHDEGRHLGQGV